MKLEEFDQRAAELNPDEMEMESELELSMYRITEWELVYYDGKEMKFCFIDYNNCIVLQNQNQIKVRYLKDKNIKILFAQRHKNGGKV